MKKFFTTVLGIILIVVGFAVIAREAILKIAICEGVKAVTGLTVEIDDMDVGLLNTAIGIKELKVLNPPDYPDMVMLDVPEIYVDYELGALFKKKIHLEEVRLDLKGFVMVKTKDGQFNVDAFKISGKEGKPEQKEKEKGKVPEFYIDKLELKVGTIIFKDYSKGQEPEIRQYDLNIDEEYEDISDLQTFINIIVSKAITNVVINSVGEFDLEGLSGGVTDALKGATGLGAGAVKKAGEVGENAGDAVVDTVTDTIGSVTDTIKKILP